MHCIIYSVVPPPGAGAGNRSAWSDCGSTRGGPVTAATSAAAVRGHNTTAPIFGHPRPGLATIAIIFWLTPFPRIRFFSAVLQTKEKQGHNQRRGFAYLKDTDSCKKANRRKSRQWSDLYWAWSRRPPWLSACATGPASSQDLSHPRWTPSTGSLSASHIPYFHHQVTHTHI